MAIDTRISKKDARAQGLLKYFTGARCAKGHTSERYTASGNCVMCAKGYAQKDLKDAGLRALTTTPPPDLPPSLEPFVWGIGVREALVEAWVNSGDISEARDLVRVTPAQYHREIENNPVFASMIEDARPLATRHLEDRAVSLALAGDNKLLQTLLKARGGPEFKDSLKLDVSVTSKMTDAQIQARIEYLSRGRIIDSTATEVEPALIEHKPAQLAQPLSVETGVDPLLV